ncbi:hypothetical protein E5163_02750 [Marinicauda algicola]|uniref:SMODS-associating 2TM beta-strand rich effector domain-containing protein n=1 Tax=Marinicauda algicola TaxID=2029849 RepID=A0A4S2H3C8_9PROT|nr:hypothetical protein [Marinicauda algicola]TGY90064.1 hypothetical protein E5163_02750 [Marinicauda algicola]
MARVLGLGFWITAAAIVVLLLSAFINAISASIAVIFGLEIGADVDLAPRWLAVLAWAILITPFLPPVRKWLWRLPLVGGFLRTHVFEDLDGHWDVEVESNWPTISALLKASSDMAAGPFDPVNAPETIPEPALTKFDATIKIGWEKAEATFHPNDTTPLRQSRTVVFELIRKCTDYPARVFWGFRQFNASVEATDEDNFLGAAMLDVVSADELSGVYWNNRSWRKGLNAAGRITMRRKQEAG